MQRLSSDRNPGKASFSGHGGCLPVQGGLGEFSRTENSHDAFDSREARASEPGFKGSPARVPGLWPVFSPIASDAGALGSRGKVL